MWKALLCALMALAVSVSASYNKPHILMLLADDYGWANAGWHRDDPAKGDTSRVRTFLTDGGVAVGGSTFSWVRRSPDTLCTGEVQTPNMDALVKNGIELDQA